VNWLSVVKIINKKSLL